MRKLALTALIVVTLFVGILIGTFLNSPVFGSTKAKSPSQEITWPVIDVHEVVPVSVTLRINDDETSEQISIPLLMNYRFQAAFQDTFDYQTIDVPKKATFAQITNLESYDAVKYDMTGIPYILQKRQNVNVSWGVSPNFDDDFQIKGTLYNTDDTLYLNNASLIVSAFDINGEFLGASNNFYRIVNEPYDDPLPPGVGASFSISIGDVPFTDVAFYIVHAETTFTGPPRTRK